MTMPELTVNEFTAGLVLNQISEGKRDMKKLHLYLFIVLFIASGCAGKQGVVNVDQTVASYAKKDYGIHKSDKIRFGIRGPMKYSGKPDSLTFYAFSVDVNFKAVQEAAANKVLKSIYDDVVLSTNNAEISSSISGFSYSWDFSLSARPSVSFKLKLFTAINGTPTLYKEIAIKDFNGGEKRLLLGGLFGLLGSAINEEQDKRSQLVTNAVIKAVYDTYEKELPGLVRSLDRN